jgi:hypothetical protein
MCPWEMDAQKLVAEVNRDNNSGTIQSSKWKFEFTGSKQIIKFIFT